MNSDRQVIIKEDILIVDDTLENLRLLSTMLLKQGYNVRKALNGQMALKAVETVVPDLILLDIMMPDLDGYQVCQELKQQSHTAEIPVIFLSALNEVFDKVKAFEVGGADYITKPYQFEEVLIRVQNQLALRTAKREILQLNTQLEKRVQERTQQLEIANVRLLEMALHDSLTGLPNRALFMKHLQEALQQAKEIKSSQFAVLFLDCDRFKVVNDSLGHLVGDELLIAIAARLQSCLSSRDTLARLGGDEFALLLTEIENISNATQMATRILELFSQPFSLQRREVFINASIGITLGNCHYEKPEHLLRDADTAMYRAKALGKGRFHVFDPEMHSLALELLQLENDLRRALERQEFVLYYQPIIDLNQGKISAFEALVRWQHPQLGLVSPGAFIPLAEETGLINQIGHWVMGEACQQLSTWQRQKLLNDTISMSVNLSVRQFSQPNLIEQIDTVLTETKLDPQCLKLEITESAIMDNTQGAAAILEELKKRKIHLSIDDFGTGYSSLSYLHSFRVDLLKIDRSFVKRLNGTSSDLGLVPAIISIAQTMGMNAIAEGIETTQQLIQLKNLNCDFGQGYFFSRPLNTKNVVELINSDPCW